MYIVTVKVDENLKRKMRGLGLIGLSVYIRNATRRRVELEKRKGAAEKLVESLKVGKYVAPRGFINKTIREMREAR